MTSASLMRMISSPSSSTCVPLYLPYTTRSPTFSSMGPPSPFSRLPGPTAMTSPWVGFLDENDLLTLELDLCAAVLAVHHPVPDLQLHGHHIPLFPAPGTHRDDLTLDRLLLGGFGDVETALHGLRLLHRPDGHAIRERVDLEFRLRCRCGCHVPVLTFG